MKQLILITFAIVTGLAQFTYAKPNPGNLIDRLLKCEDDKRNMEDVKDAEIQLLRQQLYQCQYQPLPQQPVQKIWSCQAGCVGLGNVGFGTGATEAEARKNAKTDLGFVCTHHTFDCTQEN